MSVGKKWWLACAGLLLMLIISIVVWRMHAQDSKITGGHCRYDSTRLGAKVLTMMVNKDKTASEQVVVTVEVVTKDRGADTVDMSRIYPYNMYTEEDWALARIKAGDVIKCTYIKEVGGGACPPYSYRFLLEK